MKLENMLNTPEPVSGGSPFVDVFVRWARIYFVLLCIFLVVFIVILLYLIVS